MSLPAPDDAMKGLSISEKQVTEATGWNLVGEEQSVLSPAASADYREKKPYPVVEWLLDNKEAILKVHSSTTRTRSLTRLNPLGTAKAVNYTSRSACIQDKTRERDCRWCAGPRDSEDAEHMDKEERKLFLVWKHTHCNDDDPHKELCGRFETLGLSIDKPLKRREPLLRASEQPARKIELAEMGRSAAAEI